MFLELGGVEVATPSDPQDDYDTVVKPTEMLKRLRDENCHIAELQREAIKVSDKTVTPRWATCYKIFWIKPKSGFGFCLKLARKCRF
jgi:hypothetical protein